VSRTKEGGSTWVGRGRLDEREGESVRCGGGATARERKEKVGDETEEEKGGDVCVASE
jgi:hypothetical protein